MPAFQPAWGLYRRLLDGSLPVSYYSTVNAPLALYRS